MSIIEEKEVSVIDEGVEASTPITTDFGEDIDMNETPKERMKRYYNEMAIKNGYKNIEHFYVSKKFDLATKSEFDKADDYMNNLLKTIAQDMGYSQASKEFVMQNNLGGMSGKDLIGQ